MNELIKVNQETMTVSARELHDALEATERFNSWFDRMASGFTQGEDFTSVNTFTVVNNGAHRDLIDYQCSVDMAKHICLMSRTDKGKKCRQYLIDLEKAWNSPEQVMARALKLADKTIAKLQADNTALLEDNERMKPKEIFADAVSTSEDMILVGQLAKILRGNGVEIGQNRLFDWLRNNGFLIKNGEGYNLPTQYSMERELFKIKERTVANPDGSVRITKTVMVTGKGQQYFVNRFLNSDKRWYCGHT